MKAAIRKSYKNQLLITNKFIEQKRKKKHCSKMFWFKDLDTQKELYVISCIPNFDQNYKELYIKVKLYSQKIRIRE